MSEDIQAQIKQTMAEIDAKLKKNAELQATWKRRPGTINDAARQLCDRDAPPPTAEELQWLLERLAQQQRSIDQLIELVKLLLEQQQNKAS